MAVQGVVKQLRDLAKDPQNREKIVKDQGCLPGLVLFLDNDDPIVVSTALEALQYLSESAVNRPLMKKELGMLVSLEAIKNSSDSDVRSRNLARSLHNRLTAPPSPSPLKESTNPNKPKGSRVGGKHPSGSKFFVGTSKNKKWKIVTLQIKGLHDVDCRQCCEEELLKVKGVVSFTFDLVKKRCVLRTKADMKPQVLIAAISRTETMSAEQVIKNEHGEEVILSFGANPAMADKENDAHLPAYLPEDDSPIRGKAIKHIGQEDEERRTGWLGAAASFISTNFYW